MSSKKELITADMSLNINSNNRISANWVKLLDIKIDSRLNFEPHVSDLCKSAARQLNALLRLQSYPTFEARKILIESFVYSNLNYCPLVWNFTSTKAIDKIENAQKRVLRFLFVNFESSDETLLIKTKKPTMTVQRLRYVSVKLYRTVNGLNPSYIKNVFKKSDTLKSKRTQYQNNLIEPRPNYYEFGTKSLASLQPKIWNSLPVDIKSAETFEVFKKLIKTWDGEMCKCRMFTYNKNH